MITSQPFLTCLAILLPAAGGPRDAEPAGKPYVYKKVPDRELKLWVFTPPEWKATDRRPAIVFFHGGGWVGGSPGQFNEQGKYLASRGMVVVQVQYRLLTGRSGGPPTVCVQDARSAMRWVRGHAGELGIDPKRIASGGGSAGGHLAACVGLVDGLDDPQDDRAVSPKSDAMVLFNPVFDAGPGSLAHARFGDRWKEFSPLHHVGPDAPPAIAFLGSADRLIPLKSAKDFEAEMKKAGVRCDLHIYEDQPHGFFNYGRGGNRYYAETLVALDKFLVSLGWLKEPPTLTTREARP
jgi:acetyl esterase